MGYVKKEGSSPENIRLVAAFVGVVFIPLPFVLGTNNFNPKLILYDDYVEYRNLFFTLKKGFADIEEVDVFINAFSLFGVSTTNICIRFRNTVFTFIGNLNSPKRLKELVCYFDNKGVKISDKARMFMNDSDIT